MKKFAILAVILAFLTVPVLSGCQNKQMQQENEGLKKQVETLKGDKGKLETQVKDLTAKVDGLTKENTELKEKLAKPAAKKVPAKAPAKKK